MRTKNVAMFWVWEALVLVPLAFVFTMDDPTMPIFVVLVYVVWRTCCRYRRYPNIRQNQKEEATERSY